MPKKISKNQDINKNNLPYRQHLLDLFANVACNDLSGIGLELNQDILKEKYLNKNFNKYCFDNDISLNKKLDFVFKNKKNTDKEAGSKIVKNVKEYLKKFENTVYIVFINNNYNQQLSNVDGLLGIDIKQSKNFIDKPDSKIKKIFKEKYNITINDEKTDIISDKHIGHKFHFLDVINLLYFDSGYYINISNEFKNNKDVHIINIFTDKDETNIKQSCNILNIDNKNVSIINSNFVYNENNGLFDEKKYFYNNLNFWFLNDQSNLRWQLFNHNDDKVVFRNKVIIHDLGEVNLKYQEHLLDNYYTRNEIVVNNYNQNCNYSFSGNNVLNKKEELHRFILINHLEKNSKSQQVFRHIISDNAQSSFSGRIFIDDQALECEAEQLCQTMLMSKNAKIITKPQMVIKADKVKCKHGATLGKINKEALAYLMSRGLDKKQALELLLNAFIIKDEDKDKYPDFYIKYLVNKIKKII